MSKDRPVKRDLTDKVLGVVGGITIWAGLTLLVGGGLLVLHHWSHR